MYRESLALFLGCALAAGCAADRSGPATATAVPSTGSKGAPGLSRLLDDHELKAVDAQTNRALDSAADGQTVVWRSPESGARARLTPQDSKRIVRTVPLLRRKDIAPPLSLDLIGKTYVARKNSNLRAAPRVSSARVGRLRVGDRFQAIGQVTGEDWILVGRNNRSVGYVHASLVAPAPLRKIAPTSKGAGVPGGLPVTDRSQPLRRVVDLDAIKRSRSIDLKKEELVAEPVEAKQQCRTVRRRVEKRGETVSDQFRACRASDGAWELI